MKKKLETKVRDNFAKALNRFDFGIVQTVMGYLDWTWGSENHPPTENRMIEAVTELFEDAIKYFESPNTSVASGGFCVNIWKSGTVEIQFIVKSSHSD